MVGDFRSMGAAWQGIGLPANHLSYLPVTCSLPTNEKQGHNVTTNTNIEMDYMKHNEIKETYTFIRQMANDPQLNVGCDEYPQLDDFLEQIRLSKVFLGRKSGK